MPDVLAMLDAKALGLTRYFTGHACPRGHVAERMVSTRACSQCLSEKRATWRANNPEAVNEQKRNWRNANLDKARKLNRDNQKLHRDSANRRNRKWYAENRDQANATSREYAMRHPENGCAKSARYRSSKIRQMPKWADERAIRIIYRAAEVARVSGFEVHVDHVVPLQGEIVSGLHVHRNLQLLAPRLNQSKSNQHHVS